VKRFKAYATISYDLVCEFELDDDEIAEGVDPWDFAKDLDGGDFRELDGSGEWNLYEVELIEEIENA
jgi:hypothetical protein